MEERLHRVVNGEIVYLTDEEETALRAEWAANEAAAIAEAEAKAQADALKQQQKQALLQRLQLTEEEFNLLISK